MGLAGDAANTSLYGSLRAVHGRAASPERPIAVERSRTV